MPIEGSLVNYLNIFQRLLGYHLSWACKLREGIDATGSAVRSIAHLILFFYRFSSFVFTWSADVSSLVSVRTYKSSVKAKHPSYPLEDQSNRCEKVVETARFFLVVPWDVRVVSCPDTF